MITDMPTDLDNLRKEDLLSVASALLYSLKDSPRYSTISELFYLLDYQSFMNLIKYFGGKTIRVPTSSEISECLKLLLLYQYYIVEEREWKDCLSLVGVKEKDSVVARNRLIALKEYLKSHRVESRSYE